MTERPLAERYWQAVITRRGGEFPPLPPLSALGFTALQRDLHSDSSVAGRRVVVTHEGDAIWFWLQSGQITWHTVTPAQDRALLKVLDEG